MKYYLVSIDTTNRPNAKGFRPGIQNFYICLAPGEMEAKNLVLSTFRNNPNFLNQLLPCTNATPLDSITKLLSPNQALWSYIPIGGVRAPGQQKLIPNPDSLVQHNPVVNMKEPNQEFKPSSVQVSRPKTYDAQSEVDLQEAKKLAPTVGSTGGDAVDQLLSDPRFKEALLAKLGLSSAPAAKEDPEAELRHTDDGAYDDDLSAPPRNLAPRVPKSGLPTQPPAEGIPGLLEPDAETMKRLRANIKPINLETID